MCLYPHFITATTDNVPMNSCFCSLKGCYGSFESFIVNMIEKQTNRLGWVVSPTSDHSERLLQTLLLEAAVKYRHAPSLRMYQNRRSSSLTQHVKCGDVEVFSRLAALTFVCNHICLTTRLPSLSFVCTLVCLHSRCLHSRLSALSFICTFVCLRSRLSALSFVCALFCLHSLLPSLFFVCTLVLSALSFVLFVCTFVCLHCHLSALSFVCPLFCLHSRLSALSFVCTLVCLAISFLFSRLPSRFSMLLFVFTFALPVLLFV
jgi:hypothetical protein